ncbi:MAG: PAS domain S-box protein, partial [bacterium]
MNGEHGPSEQPGEGKRAEEKLRAEGGDFSTLVEHATDMIVRFDANLRHIYCNPAVEIQLGAPVKAWIGKTPLETSGPRAQAEFVELSLRKALETGEEQEVEQSFPLPSGTKHFLTRIVPERDEQGRIQSLLAITRDITERKKTEDTLRESEEKYRLLVENVKEAIFVVQDGKLAFTNPIVAEMIGYSSQELLSQSFVELIHPEDRALFLERDIKRLGSDESPGRYLFRLISRSGDTKWVELNTVPIQWGGQPAAIHFLIDIGAREQLKRETAKKITGQLTAGIAHQIRNPLFVISLSVQSIEKKLPAKDPQRRLTQAILDKVRKLDVVTADLVHLGKYHELHITNASLHKRLELALILVRAPANAQRVKVVRRYYPHLPQAWLDVEAMDEVFANLFTNALEAMPEGGLLTVETSLDEERKKLLVRIQDTGCGIPKEFQENIFVPFSTTKESGSGLGLVFCQRIV